jgi:hypothetical protein
MADHDRMLDTERREQVMGIGGKLLEGELIAVRLAGFAKTQLIDGDDAKTGSRQAGDRALPRRRAEILAML